MKYLPGRSSPIADSNWLPYTPTQHPLIIGRIQKPEDVLFISSKLHFTDFERRLPESLLIYRFSAIYRLTVHPAVWDALIRVAEIAVQGGAILSYVISEEIPWACPSEV
jgi:hypothetical protein